MIYKSFNPKCNGKLFTKIDDTGPRMKTIAILLIGASSAWAQTNFFPLLECRSATYTNVTISHATPAYAILTWSGGSAQVSLGDLPESVQKQYGYDRANAEMFLQKKKDQERATQAEVAKARIAYEKYIAALAGTNQPVWIMSINSDAPYTVCTARTLAGNKEICVKNLPQRTRDFVVRLAQLRIDVVNAETRTENYTMAAKRADAAAPIAAEGNADYVNAAMTQRSQANNMAVNAEQMQNNLAKMKSALALMETQELEKATVTAYPTGQFWSGKEIWICSN